MLVPRKMSNKSDDTSTTLARVQSSRCTKRARQRTRRPSPRAPLPTHPVNCAPRNLSNALSNMSDGNNLLFPRKLLKKFIILYKNQPCLWDRQCTSYKIKQKRNDALSKLTKFVQCFDYNATRLHVLRKIDSLRTCVRREYKKVVESRRTATNEDEVYTPQLWYYELLSFIFTDEENSLNSFKTKEQDNSPDPLDYTADSDIEEDGDDDDEHPFETSLEHSYTEYNSSNINDMSENSGKRYSNFDDEKNKRHCTEIEDEYDAIGINVAAKLRSLPSNMRILAEKLINDVLFQAQTNALTTASVISTQDPFK